MHISDLPHQKRELEGWINQRFLLHTHIYIIHSVYEMFEAETKVSIALIPLHITSNSQLIIISFRTDTNFTFKETKPYTNFKAYSFLCTCIYFKLKQTNYKYKL